MKPQHLNDNDRSVLGALGESPRPLSAYDILDRARSDALKAPVQVYRALQKLEGRGLVHRIEALNAFVACSEHDEACSQGEHSHPRHRPGFVICRDCGTVREFFSARPLHVSGLTRQLSAPFRELSRPLLVRAPGRVNLASLVEQHRTGAVVYDIAPPYYRNWQFCATAAGVTSARARVYVLPWSKFSFKARSSQLVRFTLRYRVPRDIKLREPTIFYVARRGAATFARRVDAAD